MAVLPAIFNQLRLSGDFPKSPGVYIFYGINDLPIYIGKSINLRQRIRSHFYGSLLTSTDQKLAREITRIETIPTAGELGALILESQLIKQRMPVYNRVLRRSRRSHLLIKDINAKGYLTASLIDTPAIEIDKLNSILAIFKSKNQAKNFLSEVSRKYNLCPKLLNNEKGDTSCFNYHLGICQGACIGQEKPEVYNARFLEVFEKTRIKQWPFLSPVIYKEVGDSEEYFLIYRWCLLGKYPSLDELINSVPETLSFDYDTYKILYAHLTNPQNFDHILFLKPESSPRHLLWSQI